MTPAPFRSGMSVRRLRIDFRHDELLRPRGNIDLRVTACRRRLAARQSELELTLG